MRIPIEDMPTMEVALREEPSVLGLPNLTRTEKWVLALACHGYWPNEISARTDVPRFRVRNIIRKNPTVAPFIETALRERSFFDLGDLKAKAITRASELLDTADNVRDVAYTLDIAIQRGREEAGQAGSIQGHEAKLTVEEMVRRSDDLLRQSLGGSATKRLAPPANGAADGEIAEGQQEAEAEALITI